MCATTPYLGSVQRPVYRLTMWGLARESPRPHIHRFRPQARAPPLGVSIPHQRCSDGEVSVSGVSEAVCEAPIFTEWFTRWWCRPTLKVAATPCRCACRFPASQGRPPDGSDPNTTPRAAGSNASRYTPHLKRARPGLGPGQPAKRSLFDASPLHTPPKGEQWRSTHPPRCAAASLSFKGHIGGVTRKLLGLRSSRASAASPRDRKSEGR